MVFVLTRGKMADPVIGELLPVLYLPKSDQPGGIGTVVTDPTQTVEEQNGLYHPGCGHSVNSYDVSRAAVGGITSAIVKCPICGYVEAIFTPASLFDNLPDVLQA